MKSWKAFEGKTKIYYETNLMIVKFFEKYNISKQDKIIIACSGWVDSMFLLSETLKKHPKTSIIVAHFNHNLRWEESDSDADFIKGFCEENWLAFELWNEDIRGFASQEKLWIEEAARIKRYEFLEMIRTKYGAKHIMTAHHLDDSIETFVFNLIRWTKLGWLTWIDELNSNVIRPLLHMPKSEIRELSGKENIPYRDDSTNLDDAYLRNHIRLNIIPEFSKINPNYKNNLDDLMQYFKELQGYIENDVKMLINIDNSFDIDGFKDKSQFLQKEIIANIFKITNSWTIGLTKWNIDEVIRFINDKWNYTKKEIKKMHLFKKNWKVYF